MDPNATFQQMADAWRTYDDETARERAWSLREWYARGGFRASMLYGKPIAPDRTYAWIDMVMRDCK